MNDVAREPRMQRGAPGFKDAWAEAYPAVSPAAASAAPPNSLPVPPHSLDAESAVLGALMLDNRVWPSIEGIVGEQDFYNGANREIFAATRELLVSGQAVDVVTLANALGTRRKLEYVGGDAYLLALVENVPTAANVVHYARIVHERSVRRQLATLGNDAATAALSPGLTDAATLVDDFREKVDELALNGASAGNLEPLDLASLAARAIPERKFIAGRILPQGKPGGITGHGAAAKTQLALALDICVAAHIPFFGEPTAPAIAAHVSTEEDETELHIRIAAQCAALGVEFAVLGSRLFLYDLTDGDPTLVTVAGDGSVAPTKRYKCLKTELRRRGVDVVTLDNFATLCAVDVIRPGHVTHAIALLNALLPPDGNVIILGHVDKATARAGYGKEAYSGTAAIHNRLRWRWYLFAPRKADDADPGGETPEDDGRRILEVQKNNGGPSGQRISLRIRKEDGALVADGVQGGIVATIQRGNERKAVLQAVAETMQRGIPVPTAGSGRSTAYEPLAAMPAYPDALRGGRGKQRLHQILMQLRADGELEVYEFRAAGRHLRQGYRVAPIQSEAQ